MENRPVSSRMYSLLVLFDMHTTYFSNVLEGISDEDAHNRLNTKANHVAWLAGSLVSARFEHAGMFGITDKPAADAFFADHQGIQDGVTYPSLASYQKDWQHISPILRKALHDATDEWLDSTFDMEGMTMSHYEFITFLTHREPYCIGQIGLWRRLLGYPAMRYQ